MLGVMSVIIHVTGLRVMSGPTYKKLRAVPSVLRVESLLSHYKGEPTEMPLKIAKTYFKKTLATVCLFPEKEFLTTLPVTIASFAFGWDTVQGQTSVDLGDRLSFSKSLIYGE